MRDVDARGGEGVLPLRPRAVRLAQQSVVHPSLVRGEPYEVVEGQEPAAPEVRRRVHALPTHLLPFGMFQPAIHKLCGPWIVRERELPQL